jgi:hypothetical protein
LPAAVSVLLAAASLAVSKAFDGLQGKLAGVGFAMRDEASFFYNNKDEVLELARALFFITCGDHLFRGGWRAATLSADRCSSH